MKTKFAAFTDNLFLRLLLFAVLFLWAGFYLRPVDAAFAAFAAEYALFRFLFPKTSLTAISVTAATLHNIVQNLVFCLVTETPEALIYLPYLALTGAVAGVIVGLAAYLTVKALPKNYFAR